VICVDASFALKLVLEEAESAQVEGLWRSWIGDDRDIIAPYQLLFEVTSVIRNHVYRQNLSMEAGEMAFTAIHKHYVVVRAIRF